jgi:hypothetical protein
MAVEETLLSIASGYNYFPLALEFGKVRRNGKLAVALEEFW